MCCAGNRWVQSLWNDGCPIHMLAHVRYPPQSPPGVLFQRQNIFLSLIIPEHPRNNMRTSKCMFGTSTPCMTFQRMGYSAAGVFTRSSHAQYARRLWCSFGWRTAAEDGGRAAADVWIYEGCLRCNRQPPPPMPVPPPQPAPNIVLGIVSHFTTL